ncbi:pentapeptide repeat-containing protein [candidate division KSB1 bacterium]|nr:pentapeptide repeat-containing protein [candidate division KSB1 bacterium]
MANPDHLKILKNGIKEWNAWRKSYPLTIPDLRDLKLKGAKLWGINLHRADLSGANLKGATLLKSNLIEANFSEANLEDARLMIAEMWGTKLCRANLTGADLRMAEIGDSDLTGAVLKNTNLGRANLMAANLSDANLQNCMLIETNLNDAILSNTIMTGVTLYRCTTFGWKLKKIQCDYIYTDIARKYRNPKSSFFYPGEFEDLYKSKPTMEFLFDHGITWIDSLIIELITNELEKEKPGFGLKLISYDGRGGQSRAIFAIASQAMEDDALKELKSRYEIKSKMIENRMDFMFQFILQANQPLQNENIISEEYEKLKSVHNKNINICTNAINEIKNAILKQHESTFINKSKREILIELEIYLRDMPQDGLKATGEKVMKLTQEELVPILPLIVTQLAVLTINKQL